MPLNEILVDFNDKIKSMTRGYGSMDYEYDGYTTANLVKLDILVNDEPVDAFSSIVHRDKAEGRARQLARSEAQGSHPDAALPSVDPGGHRRQDRRARKRQSAMRKNVTAKCYGGDISRKRKLLEKQKEGKKRMKSIRQGEHPAGSFHRSFEGRLGGENARKYFGLIRNFNTDVLCFFLASPCFKQPSSLLHQGSEISILLAHHARKLLHRRRDVMSDATVADLDIQMEIDVLKPPRATANESADQGSVRARLDKEFAAAQPPAPTMPGWRENCEVLLVAIRAGHRYPRVFPATVQDSRLGSMEPTLNGITAHPVPLSQPLPGA